MCGENASRRGTKLFEYGSSPRVRGKRQEVRDMPPCPRLIPACAGKTVATSVSSRADWAHPRVCGENERTVNERACFVGSSPRVRGKPARRLTLPRTLRLIPACAGKTCGGVVALWFVWAHPRVCGENDDEVGLPVCEGGSSPRVRGKQVHAGLLKPRGGLIPACAGKTERGWKPFPHGRAHPRVCGEN